MDTTTIIGIIALICAIWVIYDLWIVQKKMSAGSKILWTILAIIFSIITAIVYYFVKKKQIDWNSNNSLTFTVRTLSLTIFPAPSPSPPATDTVIKEDYGDQRNVRIFTLGKRYLSYSVTYAILGVTYYKREGFTTWSLFAKRWVRV